MSDDGLKVGDEIILSQSDGWSTNVRSVERITRLTATLVIIAGQKVATLEPRERKFARKGFMSEVGNRGYHTPSLEIATPELLATVREEVRQRVAFRVVEKIAFGKLTADQLERIAAIAAEPKP